MPSLIALPLFFLPLFSFALSGEELYKRHCSECHGEDRTGKTAPPLLPQFLKRKSTEELKRIIREGIPASQMPPFELSDAELSALVSYITSPARAINYPFEELKIIQTPSVKDDS